MQSTVERKMTMAATLVNSLKYRFHTLHEPDQIDILDGNEFLVQYIGCTSITEDYEMACDAQIDDFFNFVVSEYQVLNAEGLLFKLIVNRNGAIIYDTNDNIQYNFEAHNISYVTTTNSWRYSKYLIIVARTGQEKTLKGHVLLCRNKANAKLICQTFTEMFKMARPVTITTANQEVFVDGHVTHAKSGNQGENCPVFDTATARTYNPIAGHALCSVTNHNPLNDRQTDTKLEELLDDGFTELAKSRSSSTNSVRSSNLTPPLFGTFFNENNLWYPFIDSVFR